MQQQSNLMQNMRMTKNTAPQQLIAQEISSYGYVWGVKAG